MSERRVVITGVGVLSPIGINLDALWSSLIAGKSGIDKITSLDPSDFYCHCLLYTSPSPRDRG